MTENRTLALCGTFAAFLAVALGAFGAHGLSTVLSPDQLATYQTGVTYQMWHALAVLLCCVLAQTGMAAPGGRFAGWLFVVGIVLFSGSLYALTLTDVRGLGIVTPLGGLCFLAGWLWLAVNLWSRKMNRE